MPSQQHQVLVELFRASGELAPAVLAACAHLELPHHHVELSSVDLSEAAPTEYRADVVLELRAQDQTSVASVIVEVQLHRDDDKPFTWPVYIANLRAKLRCRVILLVVTPEPSVAEWARRPIEIGHPGFVLQPIAVSFADLPRSIDPVQARKLPALAVLAALAYPEIDTAMTAVRAIKRMSEDDHRLYLDLILSRLPDALRTYMEAMMLQEDGPDEEWRFSVRLEKRGERKGVELGMQSAALEVVRVKLAEVSAADEAAIQAVHEPDALRQLIAALVQANSRADVRAVLDGLAAR